MGKYDKAAKRVLEEKKFEKEQSVLKRKYAIEDENVIIKEKSGLTKFMVKTTFSIIRITTEILLYALASIGLMCLIYPSTREKFISIMVSIWNEIIMFF